MAQRPHLAMPLLLLCPLCAYSLTASMAQATLPPAQDAQTTIRTTSNLVVVDVIVLDRSQRPVPGLKASDFTVRESGAVQTVKSFESHASASPPQGSTATPTAETSQSGIFSNAPLAADSGNLNVLLIDTLNTQMAEQSYVRSEIQTFLKSQSGSSRFAVFAFRNNRLVLLQGFTSDTGLLKTAVNNSQAAGASALLSDPTGLSGENPTVYQTPQGKSTQLQLRDRYTLEAINQLARYLAQFPGRKSLFWFAGSFPLSIYPDVSLFDIADADIGAAERLRDTSRLLTQGRIAVYPVDSRGAPAPFASDAVNAESVYVTRPDIFVADANNAAVNENNDHLIMEQMARDTGGRAFYNTNGISQAVARAIDAAGHSYTLTYTPSGKQSASGYRAIDVQVSGGKYSLAYRHGYFDDGSLASTAKSDPLRLAEAMRMGAPDAMQIVFKARVLPAAGAAESAVAPNNTPNAKLKGPWRRCMIDIAADPRPLRWTRTSDGLAQNKVEFVAIVYDQEGRVVNSLSDTVTHTFNRANMLEAARAGLDLSGQISVPSRGSYWLRIGIRDPASGSIGTVELPVSSIRGLPPISPTAK